MNPTSQARAHAEHGPHVMPPSVLLGVFGALIGLTVLTLATARIDLGEWNVVLALAIASSKAVLVALFFMHLKYERRAPIVVLLGAAFFAVLFVAFVVFDTTQYQPDIRQAVEAAARAKGG